MWGIALFVGASVLLVAVLVWATIKYPDHAALKEIKDWQTLIGALLGFTFLSSSIVLNQWLESDIQSDRQEANERAYLEVLSLELADFQEKVSTEIEILSAGEAPIDTGKCMRLVQTLKRNQIPVFSLEPIYPEVIPSMSSDFNRIAASSFGIRARYRMLLVETDHQDCMISAGGTWSYMQTVHDGIHAQLENQEQAVSNRLKLLD